MKKTITSLAIAVATTTMLSGHSLPYARASEPEEAEVKTICLNVDRFDKHENIIAEACDATQTNRFFGVKLTPNGCGAGQIVIQGVDISIPRCVVPVML